MIEQGLAAIDVDHTAHDQYIRKSMPKHEQLIWIIPA